ncbi:MAG: hypothetical protein HZA81_00500 [Candidatus Taylorbacteria bacterium]|nr:hypothetical protein [Candidatus Taylorbacteria bacterium]
MKGVSKKDMIFVLFGATGDLAAKKILPAIESLVSAGEIGASSKVVAVSRREWDDAGFLSFFEGQRGRPAEPSFAAAISYSKVDIAAGVGYKELKARLDRMLAEDPSAELLVYFSLAPDLYSPAFKDLVRSRVLERGKRGKIMIEKPFGTDQKSACALDRLLASKLDPDQILRVDHYLGKDTVRAIMDLHERATHMSDLVSSEAVSSIRVRLFETKGIDGRGASYEGVGAFRDVGQNHMLETLAALGADLSTAGSWQEARADFIKRLVPPANTCDLSRRGQYEGYEAERGVRVGSQTETSFHVETSLRSGKLKSVPLVLESGKKMQVAEAFAEICFKDISGLPKRMRFSIQPKQEIVIENRDGSKEVFEVPRSYDAYGNIILAALYGSEREFVGPEEIEALWGYADHVVACWDRVPLEVYSDRKPFLIK